MPRGPLLCNGVRKVRAKTGKPNAKGWLSPPYRLPLGIPVKNSIKRARYDGKRELLFSYRPPRDFFLPLPSLPATQRGLTRLMKSGLG